MKKGYKETEIGIIPENWEIELLGDCLVDRPSYGINAAAVPYSDRLPVYLRITDISEDGRYLSHQRVSVCSAMSSNYNLLDGDIVLARTGASVGKSYKYNPNDGPLVYAGFLIKISPNEKKLLSSFVMAYLKTDNYWRWVRLMSMRSGQPGINGNEYAQLLIPAPPLAEQGAIATALSDIDALIEDLSKLITKQRDIKQATMQQLLTGKTRLPGFSGEREEKTLGDVLEKIVGGGTPSRANPAYWNGEIPWVTVKDFATFNAYSAQEYISINGLKNSASNLIPAGTLITSTRMAVGKSVVYKIDVAINQDLKALYFYKTVSVEFMAYWFEFHEQLISEQGSGSTVKGISIGELQRLKFNAPQYDEQVAIVQVLSDMDNEIDALEKRLEKTRMLKQGMMQELLTGRIRLV